MGLLLLVVAVKAGTSHRLGRLEASIRDTQSEETDVSQRLQSTETALRQLEQEEKALDQEFKHLENDKDLVCLEITHLGGTPVPESKLDETPAAKPAARPAKAAESDPDQKTDSESEPEPGPEDSKETVPSAQNAPSRPSGGRSRILVVDDNNELRALLQQALSDEYEVLVAEDGFAALSQIVKEKQHYDLVITDLNMPNVNGITLVEHLPKHIPTIIISAFLKKPAFLKALEKLQPAGVFEKPFAISDLRKAVREALDGQASDDSDPPDDSA